MNKPSSSDSKMFCIVVNIEKTNLNLRFVAKDGQWDGGWTTDKTGEARLYKLARNAQKWLAERPNLTGIVVEAS